MKRTPLKRTKGLRKQSEKAKIRQRELNGLKSTIIKEQRGRCNRCGKEIRADGVCSDLHHKRKRSLGGTDARENLEVVCTYCHRVIIHVEEMP